MRRTYAVIAAGAAPVPGAGARHRGHDLSRGSGIRSGVMCPVPQRMPGRGRLAGPGEGQAQAGRGKRPPRRCYQLSAGRRTPLAQARRMARETLMTTRTTSVRPEAAARGRRAHPRARLP